MLLHIVTQQAVCRDHDLAALAGRRGWRHTGLPPRDSAAILHALEATEAGIGDDVRPVVFCAIPAARAIRRRFPRLARGLFLPETLLAWHRYTSLLAEEENLNAGAILLPWHRLPAARPMLGDLFGEHLFVRPDSPLKPFTGFTTRLADLGFEHGARCQTDRVAPHELCVIARARTIAAQEFRFWLVDGQVSAAAPSGTAYGWDAAGNAASGLPDGIAAPEPLRALATDLARRFEDHDNLLVADLVMEGDAPRLVEMNAVSTAGFYPGLNPEILLDEISALLAG